MSISLENLAHSIQYTNVRPEVTRAEMVAHAERALEYQFHAAMVPMCWVPLVKEVLKGSPVRVATCFGLGLGHESLYSKLAMTRECLALGADEVDYGPNMGFFLSGMLTEFQEEARQIVQAAEGMTVKVMLELGFIAEEDRRILAAQLLDEAGVPWVKNSSGWGPGSEAASPENIRLLRRSVSPRCKVKASGKISSYEKAIALLDAGAELLGASAAPEIMRQIQGNEKGY
jgi:deoxyribose-phosphate aldolase